MHIFFRLKKASVFGVILTVFLSSAALTGDIGAEASQIKWPWSAGQFTVYSSIPVGTVGPSWCQSQIFQQRDVVGLEGVKNMCMMSNNSVQFGVYESTIGYEAAISFNGDGKMYKIPNLCRSNDECLYLSGTDSLVRKEFITGTPFPSLVVYKNFTQRLSLFNDPTTFSSEYLIDNSSPSYTFSRTITNTVTGEVTYKPWLIGGIGASINGEWLALEFRGAGIGLLNIETLQMKRVSSDSFTYDAGYHHQTEFAVSNDGAHVVRMGFDSGLLIIDTDPMCGDIPTGDNMNGQAAVVNRCKTASNNYSFIQNFKYGSMPKFGENGGQLEFITRSSSVGPRQVVLRAFNYFDPRLDYLALGDSYSSGEGETDDNKYIIGTNIEHEKCHTSTRSYPFVMSEIVGINQNLMKSVACCAARTVDVVGESGLYMGQNDRLGVGHLNLNNVDLLLAKTKALSDFLPGRILQSDFVSEYTPKAITIGIGGNDAGFMEKLTACLSPTTCKWAGTAKGKEQTAVEIKNLFSVLVDTYTQIHNKSPNSKIYAIGYPKIINETGECGGLVGLLFDKAEREFIVQNIKYLNKVVEAAAGAAGVKYVDIYDSFGDHALCGLDKAGAINAVMLGDDMGLLGKYKWLRFIGQESFHPNPLGHSLTAAKIVEQIGNILTYNYCGGKTVCPNGQSVPEPLSALLPDGYHDYPVQKNVAFASVNKIVTSRAAKMSDVVKYKILMPNNSFKPNSIVAFEVDNVPESGQVLAVSNSGSVNAEVTVPDNLDELYLVLHLVGDSYADKPVDYYQTIRYFMPDYVYDESISDDEDGDDDDESEFDIIASLFIPPKIPIVIPLVKPIDDEPPVVPPVVPADSGLSIKKPILPITIPKNVVLPVFFAPEAELANTVDETNFQAEPSQISATYELAKATSSPEVKGAAISVKSDIKPSSGKSNNFLRDWLIPRLGYGLLSAIIFALIIIKIKKSRHKRAKK